jgi:putative DNA primase/helicase
MESGGYITGKHTQPFLKLNNLLVRCNVGTRNSTQLKIRMASRWLNAFSDLAPGLQHAIANLGQNVPCPLYGGTDGFRLFDDANETGGGVKQSERVIPEGIDMLMWVNDWSFTKAYDELETWLGGSSINSLPVQNNFIKPVIKNTNSQPLRNWLNKMWKDALILEDVESFPAKIYFKRRWIDGAANAASDLKFHPCLEYKDKHGNKLGTSGALLALVRNNQGIPVSIHRTYIYTNGNKADFGEGNSVRKMTPPVNKQVKGRQIQLFQPINGCIGISEGLETALAVHQAKGFPVWPCISNTMLQTFIPPKGVHTVLNFVDKDRNNAGEKSALILEEQLRLKGIKVLNLLPPTPILPSDAKGVDWADQLIRDSNGFDLIDQALSSCHLKSA